MKLCTAHSKLCLERHSSGEGPQASTYRTKVPKQKLRSSSCKAGTRRSCRSPTGSRTTAGLARKCIHCASTCEVSISRSTSEAPNGLLVILQCSLTFCHPQTCRWGSSWALEGTSCRCPSVSNSPGCMTRLDSTAGVALYAIPWQLSCAHLSCGFVSQLYLLLLLQLLQTPNVVDKTCAIHMRCQRIS